MEIGAYSPAYLVTHLVSAAAENRILMSYLTSVKTDDTAINVVGFG